MHRVYVVCVCMWCVCGVECACVCGVCMRALSRDAAGAQRDVLEHERLRRRAVRHRVLARHQGVSEAQRWRRGRYHVRVCGKQRDTAQYATHPVRSATTPGLRPFYAGCVVRCIFALLS